MYTIDNNLVNFYPTASFSRLFSIASITSGCLNAWYGGMVKSVLKICVRGSTTKINGIDVFTIDALVNIKIAIIHSL